MATIDVTDNQGRILGWVVWDLLGDVVDVEGVRLPALFHLRLAGDADQPALQIKYEVYGDRFNVSAIHLDGKPRGREVTPTDVEKVRRQLPQWTEVTVKAVMHHQVEQMKNATAKPDFVSSEEASSAYSAMDRKQKRRKKTPRFLQEVADLYREFFNENPWEVIAGHYSVSESTAARYVMDARKAGYLPETSPGRKKV